MAVATTLTQLESVQAKIAELESGANTVEWGDVKIVNERLSTLYAREKELLARYHREKSGTGRIRLNMT